MLVVSDVAADPAFPSVQTTYPGTTTQDTAIGQCANFAVGQPDIYLAFQLYYLTSVDAWTCQAYYGSLDDQAFEFHFNVENEDAAPAFGYQYEQ